MFHSRTKGTTGSTKAMVLGSLLVLAAMVLMAKPAHADTTFTVNSVANNNDLDFPSGIFDNSSDGKCDVDSATAGEQCTLRAAIQEANVTAGADTIEFNIPGSGVHTISPGSVLPEITDQVTINGYSQPGATPNTLTTGTNANLLIELNGTDANAGGIPEGLAIEASNTVVKGLVINRFDEDGIGIFQDGSQKLVTNVRIEGNFIGTDPSGTLDLGNRASGVFIFSSSDNTIGGASPAARNLISGNDFGGVFIESYSNSGGFADSTNNRVEGNLIGLERDGIGAMGNADDAVTVIGDTASGNPILSNSISSNAGLGIDLLGEGPTPNDPGDTDVGSNDLQNFPVLTSARTSRKGTTIKATLNSRPGAAYTIQFFSNPPGTDEGARFIGQRSVSVDANGDASLSFKPKKKVGVGQNITATATDEFTGDTSEFSAPATVRRAR